MKNNYEKKKSGLDKWHSMSLLHSSFKSLKGSVFIFFLLSLILINYHVDAQGVVTGTVLEEASNEPLPGVTIQIKGTSTGVITDLDGSYRITASPDDVLVFSFIGFQNQEITVGSKTMVSVSLAIDVQELSEVVVTALGIEREEKSLGYAVASVGANDINASGNMNVGTALSGKLAGVRVNAGNGGAASAVNVQVRGVSSISGNTQPLYVIDGIPMRNNALINTQNAGTNDNFWEEQRVRENGLIDINPQDIETLTVLKGASASALYGSDGLNGVVVITTKKGASKKKGLGLDVSLHYDLEQLQFQPDWQNSYGPGYDGDNNEAITGTREGWIREADGAIHPYYGAYAQFGPKFDGTMVTYWDGSQKEYKANEDNYKDFFNTGFNKTANVAISNAWDKGSFRLSYARQDYKGIMPGFDQEKNNFNLNTTVNLNDKISVSLVSSYINTYVHNRPYMLNQIFGSYSGFFNRMDDMSIIKSKYQTSEGYKYVTYNSDKNDEERLLYPYRATNLLDYFWNQDKDSKDETSNRFLNSVTLKYQISDKFMLRGRIGNDYTASRHETKQSSQYASSFGYTGYYALQTGNYSRVYGDVLATYNETLSSDLKMHLSVGGIFRDDQYVETMLGTNSGLVTENYFNIINSAKPLTAGSNGARTLRNEYQAATFGIAELSFRDYLYVQGTGRYEGRSTLPSNVNTYFYPSVNASFVFSEVFSMPNFVDYGKFRASFGSTANSPAAYQASVTYGINSINGTANRTVIRNSSASSGYGNDDIKLERKNEYEFGLEASLLENKLSIDFAYYNNVVNDQILNMDAPASSGATSMLANIGTLANQGLELAVNATPVRTADFRWDVTFNYGFNKNKLKKLKSGLNYLTTINKDGGSLYIRAEVGEALGNIYVLPYERDNQGNKIVDGNGYYSLDTDADYKKIGNIMPKAVGGLINTFDYKNFNLRVVTDYKFGAKMVSTPYLYMKGAGMFESTMNYRDAENGGLAYDIIDGEKVLAAGGPYHDGVVLPGVTAGGEANTTVIDAASYYMNSFTWGGYGNGAEGQYEAAVMDNSFIKLREVSLTYSLPNSFVSNVGLQKVQFSLVGRNLFYIWKNTPDNWDPEAGIGNTWFAQGVDNAAAAPTRSMGVVLSAKF